MRLESLGRVTHTHTHTQVNINQMKMNGSTEIVISVSCFDKQEYG